ncbi:MAG: TonB-dependent receptor [Deltaproteobacteria bacterium]|nr:TonB-dependent receptor [Deltaproteobacteria bacterium]
MKFFFLLFFLVFSPIFSLAGEPQQEETLTPVVVTATRIETPQQEVTTSVTVITSEDIRAQQAEMVLEVLRNVTGVDVVQSGSRGNTTSIFIRGSNSNQVLVLVDGMEVNSVTAGNFDFAHLLTDNVERIEVLRGAGGTLYGSKAVGGVINIITKKGQGKPQVTLSADGGNGRNHREVLGLSGSYGALGYSLTPSYLRTGGFRATNDNYRSGALSARLDYDVIKDGSLKAILTMTDTSLGLVNDDVSCEALDRDAHQKDQHWTGQMEWKQKLLPQWDYRLSMGVNQSHELFRDADTSCFSPRRTLIRPRILSPQFQTNYRFGSGHHLTFGVDLDRRYAKYRNTDSSGDMTAFNKSQSNQALYLQDQFKLLRERLILVGGIRYDHNGDFGSEWSPALSAAYLVRETGTKLKASYAEGFRAPAFNDLFFPGFSNPNLSPEVSWEFNAGIEQRLWQNRLKLETIYFHREVKDLIVFRGSKPENVGQVIFDGAEMILEALLGYGFSFKGNYTYVNFSDRLTRRPKHKANLILGYQNGPLNIHFNSHVTGRHLDVDAVNFNTIDKGGLSRFDLSSSYALPWQPPGTRQVSLYAKIENLFNKKYEEADGFRARPLNFLIGVRGTFGKD